MMGLFAFLLRRTALIRRAAGTTATCAALICQLPSRGVATMQKPGDGWFDQRLIELAAVIAVVVLIASGVRYLNEPAPAIHASFIVPSQTVHW